MYAVRSPNYLMSDVASINYLSEYTSYMTMISIYLYNQIFPQFVVTLIISDIIPSVNRLWKILSYGSETSRYFVHFASKISDSHLFFSHWLQQLSLVLFLCKRQKEPKIMALQPQSSAPISPSSNPITRWLYSFSLHKQPAFHRCAVLPRHYYPGS